MEYLSLRFQKTRTKIEVVLCLPCWLSQLCQQGRLRTTSILVRAFRNFKLKVLQYSRNCSLHNTLKSKKRLNHLKCTYLLIVISTFFSEILFSMVKALTRLYLQILPYCKSSICFHYVVHFLIFQIELGCIFFSSHVHCTDSI